MVVMQKQRIPADALVLVGDGAKALFLRNRGTAEHLDLVVERVLEQENPATREQGTDQPGRTVTPGGMRSAMEQTDWHDLGEERFAKEIAAALYRRAHAGRFTHLVVIAPAPVLGNLRKAFHKEVSDRVSFELVKELTSRPIWEIEKLLAA